MNTQLPQSVPETQAHPMNYMYSFPMPQIPQTMLNQTFPVNTPNMYSTEMINNAIAQIYMNNMMNMQLAMMANGQYQAHTQTQVQPSTTIPVNTISIPQQNILNDTKSVAEEETKSNDSKKEKGFSYLKIDKGYLKITFLKFPIEIIMAAKVEYEYIDPDGNKKKHYMLVPAKDFFESDEFCLEQTFNRIEKTIEQIIFYSSSFVSIRPCIAYHHHDNFDDYIYNYFGELFFDKKETKGKSLRGEIPSSQAYSYDIGKKKYKSIYLGIPLKTKQEATQLEKVFNNMFVKFRFYNKSEKKNSD